MKSYFTINILILLIKFEKLIDIKRKKIFFL